MTRNMECPRPLPLVILLVLGLLVAPAIGAEDDCAAEVTGELVNQEKVDDLIHLQFEVDVTAPDGCSVITYDLVIEEMLPNRNRWTKNIRVPRRVEVDGGSLTERVEHTMTSDLEMLGWEVKLVSCEPCR